MTNWFISVNGEQKGPYPTDQLRQLVSDGFVARDAYVWREGMPQWQPLSQVRLSDDGPAPAASVAQTRDMGQSFQREPQYSGQRANQQLAESEFYSDYVKPGYFSFQGRIGRQTFWLSYVLFNFVILAILGAIGGAIYVTLKPEPNSPIFLAGCAVIGIVYILLIIASLSAQVKRLHDRGRSGWFVLLMLVPIANIWMMIETCFLRGTDGPNEYGADPLS